MTAIECLKMLRKIVLVLILWNLLITGVLLMQFYSKQNEKLNQQICNLEAIPTFEIMEVE